MTSAAAPPRPARGVQRWPVMLDKYAVARALREIGTLLSLQRSNPFQARAYLRAADGVEATREPLLTLADTGRLQQIPGVGPSIAATIDQLVRSGASKTLDRLAAEVPPGTVELSAVPGMTEGRIRALHAALGIDSIAALRAALASGAVRSVKGFGPRTEARLRAGLEEHQRGGEPLLLVDALLAAEPLVEVLRAASGRAEIAGTLRRAHETVPSIALVAASSTPGAVLDAVSRSARVAAVEQRTATDVGLRLAGGALADVHVAPPAAFGLALLEATGSERHVARVMELAQAIGVQRAQLALPTEDALYRRVGLPFIPPELREDGGEVDAARAGDDFTDLIEIDDLRGAVHCHTDWSDGKHTIEAMARAAEALGLEYLTITDHSGAAHYAGGLDVGRLRAQWDEIAAVQQRVGVRLLRGTEADILADGAIDWPDHILDRFDVVIASVHSQMKMDEATMTARLLRAMRHPTFKIWGHALGRLLQRRPPFACDVPRVLDAIAESRAAIELNGDPYRLDLAPQWIPEARRRGIRFVIGADAHSTSGLRAMRFGVAMARRGGVRKGEVLNASRAAAFARAVRPAA